MMLALFWPSGRWASRSVRLRAAMRTSTAFSFSAAVITTWTERVTATVIGSKMRPRALTSRLKIAMRSPVCSIGANWSRRRWWPRSATRAIDSGWPAPIQNGGWGF